MAAIMDGTVNKGDVIIVRYGSQGGPGMREMSARPAPSMAV